ncbi:MAG: NUDIX domain-containing protein [Planctomycetota bacterium]
MPAAEFPRGSASGDRAIADAIARWFAQNMRVLPWRLEPRDPWLSLMSEILLQQTQVARVAERFGAFAERFPTPAAMAARPIDDVLKLWSGLGYYRRARLLHSCAQAIVERHGGRVPDNAEELRALPGVGRYTAGAVASIAFNRREALVDGNVSRVLLRVHGVDRAVDGPGVQPWAWERAEDLANAATDVARYSEGIMELGATVCTPKAPRCDACPVHSRCRARTNGLVDRIPRPKSRPERTPLAITAVVVVDAKERVLLERRPDKGLWSGLWQPPCVERDAAAPLSLAKSLARLGMDSAVRVDGGSTVFDFATTHRAVRVRVWRARAESAARARGARGRGAKWMEADEIGEIGLGSAQRRMLLAAGLAGRG